METRTERIKSVDVFRVVAILLIISSHETTFSPDTANAPEIYPFLEAMITVFRRFSVPLFIMISGYFWGKKVRDGASPISLSAAPIRKLLWLFFWWSLIYLLPYNLGSFMIYGLKGPWLEMKYRFQVSTKDPLALLFEGTQGHLWFLVALACAMAITAFFVRRESFKTLAVLSVLLYAISVLGETYLPTPLGVPIDFNTRTGPFMSTICFATGYYLSGLTPAAGWLGKGTLIFLAGCLLQYSEYFLISAYVGHPIKFGFFFGTYFAGLGGALAALSNHRLLQNERAAGLGKYTLGIYLLHFMVVENLKVLDRATDALWWEILSILVVYAISLALVVLLSNNRVTRKLVM